MKVIVVGGGIVGLATAYQLSRTSSSLEVTVLEKETGPARHQTGRNSGVIHSGVYYRENSAKARNCRAGRSELLAFCEQHGIAYDLCGKVIVATNESELSGLDELARRAQANGVEGHMLDRTGLARVEPHVRGLRALHIPEAGIVDYSQVAMILAEQFSGRLLSGAEVLSVTRDGQKVLVQSTLGEFEADRLINCGGLQCDRVCRRSGSPSPVQIIPFKGEYFRLTASAETLCCGLVYPVPDPAFPFLGVHLTRMIGGGVEVGPNAVLALGREAYDHGDLNWRDLAETLSYRGFWGLAAKHWRQGLGEMHRSLSKRAFTKALQRLCPDILERDMLAAPCGIRAQAVHPNGALEDDFLLLSEGPCLHLLNAPSPAATASLAIGREVARRLLGEAEIRG